MTHLTGIRLTNFERFRGSFELALQPGIYAVVAELEGNADRSNGLGKSGLLRAIRFALEGNKPRTAPTLDHLISEGESELGVDLEFDDGTFISRTKKRDKSVQLHVILPRDYQEPDGNLVNTELDYYQAAADEALWKHLGFSPADLLSTCIAEQRRLAALVLPPEGKIKSGSGFEEVIHDWLGLEQLVAAGDQAAAALRQSVRHLNQLEKEMAELQERWKGYDVAAAEAELEALRLRVVAHEEAIKQCAAKRAEREAWLAQKGIHDAMVNARDELSALEQQWRDLPPFKDTLELAAELERMHEQAYRKASDDYASKRTLASGGFSGTCPVNGEACPIKDKINSQNAKNEKLLNDARSLNEEAYARLKAAKNTHREQRDAAEVRTKLQAKLDYQRKAVTEWERRVVFETLGPEPIVEEGEGDGGASYLLRSKQAELDGFRAFELESKGRWLAMEQQRIRIGVQRAAVAVLGPEGAQRRISERAVHAIERSANGDLHQAGIDLQLLVRWGRETKQLAKQCSQCGFAFPSSGQVKVCETCLAVRGMQVSPELRFELSSVSGGFEDLGGLALRCAAFKWLRAKRHSDWSVAILDEPFAHLDRAHVRALSTHVQTLLASTFSQAFITAHHVSVLDSMPRRIVIKGQGKWSTVSVAA
jgi:DNA repair exonuclease SbcCD ATPase subunit